MLLIWNGLYDSSDWGPFGAFVIAPVGGVIITLASAALRIAVLYAYSKVTGKEFTALDKPVTVEVENQDHTYGSIDDDESDTKRWSNKTSEGYDNVNICIIIIWH